MATADVVVENFRPGVMEKTGPGNKQALIDNPRLIYCSIPGFANDDKGSGIQAYEGILGPRQGLIAQWHRVEESRFILRTDCLDLRSFPVSGRDNYGS
ncbi:MAG: hypothetical protein CM1200mP35_03210 [Chloroflexota bacterium]|nr:MAG: hypothetical protein CM1200mP35_03210 [Chloroflexota bacterium]